MDDELRRLERARHEPGAAEELFAARARQGDATAREALAALEAGFTFLGWEAAECAGLSHEVSRWGHPPSGLELILIPAGRARIGGERREELPVRELEFAPFLLARTPCTQAAWDRISGLGISDERSWRDPALPIEGIAWDEAAAWVAAAGLRLPSEAEWEYACRAGSTTRYYFGAEASTDEGRERFARYAVGVGAEGPRPPGERPGNAFGLFDTIGNVWEWCADAWQEGYAGAPEHGGPRALEGAHERSYRGGSWRAVSPDYAYTSYRFGRTASFRRDDLGLRPAWSSRPQGAGPALEP